MAGNFAKDPFNPSHGDSLVGQNFQSLKSQEVRDSVSPTRDLKFHSMTLNHPNTTGWDVQTSSEVSPDGRAYRTETVATTDGVEKINGGTAEFRGLNEQRASASHQGDDKNFVKKASENSNTHLQERIVVGDENSGRTEMKMSSTTTSSSSQVTSSSSAVEYGGGEPNDARYLMDNTNRQHPGQYPQQQRLTQDQYIQQQQQRQQQLQQQEFEQTKQYQQQQHQQRVQQQEQEQRQYTEEFNRNRQESSTSRNVDTQQTTEQNRRVVDVDKASPEYQKHVQYLMSQPGEIISNTVEYPKPNVKMITTVKRLPDGTIVKNKRYETEELRPAVDSPRQRTTSSTSQSSTQHRNEQQRREQTEDNVYNRQQNVRNNTTRRSEHDVVDNAEPFAHAPSQQQLIESHPTDHFTDEITNTETKFSSVKKSSRRFSTETTSETIEEFSDHAPPSHAPGIRGKPGSGRPSTQDFSTHGFPSVKPNKPTQEYPKERPHGAPQSQRPDFSTHGFPSVSPNKPTQEYPGDRVRPSDVERLNQRTVTELNNTSSNVPYGSPAVNPNSKITTTKDGDVIIVSSESTRSSKFKTNAERVIETEIVIDGDSSPNRGFPAVKQTSPGGRDSPRYGTPTREYPGSPRRPQPAEDFSTHGFPSVRSPTKQSTDFPANGFPSDRDVAKPTSAHPAPSRIINPDGSVTTISSETKKTIKHNTNREHIIETEIVGDSHQPLPSGLRQPDKITFPPTPQPTDFGTHGFPSVRESAPTNDAYRRQGTPTREYPSSPHKPQPSADFSTHGFPSVKDSAPVRESTPSRDYPSSPRQNQPSQDFSTHGFPSVRTPNKPVSDYSTPSGGFPSTRDTNAPKLMPTQSRPQPSTTTTQKSTTTTDSSQRLISKERDVDATHRAFAASLRCSSPVDSPDHHRSTPRSSVSSTRTFRRDGREGSHDSETSRISSGTVTRSSPSKSVGKTVVTKQTVVKTRNVNGSNETIDLTPQRPTKSPSPNKATTTTTTRITTTRKSPTEVPKPDNQKSKQAENTFPIINEPLTITKTHFTANDASFLGNEVVEKPCIKKHFYKLGPSDKVINNVDEKSPYSPAPSNHTNRTHPKPKSQVRDDLADVNHEEPIHNQPLSSSVIEPKQRNRSPTGPKSSSPQTICQPFKKEPSVGRRTDVRESTFENTDWQNSIQNSNETQYPVTYDKEPKDEYIETIYINETPVDTSDYPSKRGEPSKQPYNKNKTEFVTKTTTRIEKFQNNDTFDDTDEFITRQSHEKEPSESRDTNPVSKKPLDSLGKRPKEGKPIEPSNRKQGEKQPTQPAEKVPGQKNPINNSPSPTRRTSDARTSKTTTTTVKTTRKENVYDVEDDNQPKNTVDKKPSQTDKEKPNDIDRSPTRKPSDQPSNNRPKNIRQQKPQVADDITQPHEPFGKNADIENPDDFSYKIPTNKKPSVPESSPTRPITERKTLKTTSETTRKNKTHTVEDDHQPDEPLRGKPGNERTIDKKKPNDSRPLDVKFIKDDHSPTRTTSDASKLKTSTVTTTVTKTHKNTVSPTRNSKPTEIRSSVPIHKNPIKEKPSELLEKLPKYTKAAKPAPTGTGEPEQSDDEHIPTGREPVKKPLSKVDDYSETKKSTNIRYVNTNRATSTVQTPSDEKYKPVQRGKSPLSKGPSDIELSDDDQKIIDDVPVPRKPAPENSEEDSNDENQRSTFITTAIKTVRADVPQPTYQTIDDETRRVQELFNKTDKTKVTKNVNEEFITFEQQVGGRAPVLNRPEDEPGKPSKFNGKGPKSIPTIKNTEPDYRVDDTNISKLSSVTTTLKIVGRDLPSIKKPSQPEDEKPKVSQPTDADLSDDDLATHETYETTTTIEGIHRDTVPANVEGEQPRSNNKKFPKPESGKTRPSKPVNSDNDRSPTRTPTEGNTLKSVTITTTTKNTVGGKPSPDNSEVPHEPADKPTGKAPTLDETERVDALFKTTNKTKHTKNYNEEFINIESQNKETPDGAFISKAPEPEPSSPTFKKKGVSPRETFEDRCRQILGMENYGDTPGTYERKPEDESDQKEPLPVDTTKFEVKIEDCEDDEPNYLNNIKAAIKPIEKPKTHKTSDISDEELVENLVEEVECTRTDTVVPFKNTYPEREPYSETTHKSTRVIKTDIKEEEDENIVNKTTSKLVKKAPSPLPKEEQLEDVELEEFPLSEPESPEKETDDESQPDTVVSERETQYTDEFEIEERTNLVVKTEKKQPLKSDKKLPGKKSPSTSPTRKPSGKTSPSSSYPSGPSTVTTTKPVDSKPKSRETKVVSDTKPISKSPERPGKDTVLIKDKPVSSTKSRTERIQKLDTHTVSNRQPKTPNKESPTSTIKDRLRSSPRNKKPSTTESDSSPDISPTRLTERRRSSNISVHTEIIIDHSGPKSPKPTKKVPEKLTPQPKKPVPADTISQTKPFRRFPVTERKESAPVPSVSRKDKEVKMTRSTSEKVMKVTERPVKKTEVSTLEPSAIPKSDRRPNKCFTTKTINLTTTDKLINSEDMENVVIDIQHAKSSREPSPDKIVPTPVPVHLDTGKPRYPDVVQEPEDVPRKKPVITNIPIFEEESNEFINCHISEVKTDRISKLVDLEEDDILDNPTIEAPKSLEYPLIDRPDDDCLLSVHEKVSKFTHTAEEIKKPKASSPFSREFDKTPKVPDNDECLLTVDEKVNKFIKTAEEVSKPITPVREIERPSYTELDEELRKDDCTLSVSQKVNKFLNTAEKLAPTAPQRSPELVAKFVRTISKQSEPEYPESVTDDELTPFSQNHTIEIEKRRQKDILSRPTVFENTTKTNRNAGFVEEEVTIVKNTTGVPEYDEVIPHTRDHTTKLELKRQKDILSRPSIYNKNAKARPQSPSKREPISSYKPQPSESIQSQQIEYTTKKVISEDNDEIKTKAERKPSAPTTKPESRKSLTKPQKSTVAVTRSRFETSDNKKLPLKSSTEPKTSRVPTSSITARKPTNEPKARLPSTSNRKPSTEPDTSYPYTNRRKPFNEPEWQSPQRGARKQSTEPDSHYPGRKPSTESITNYENIESETEFTSTTRRRSSSKTKDYLEMVQTEIERFSPTQKEPLRKIPTQEKQKPQSFSHSPTRKDATSTTKVTQVTERTIRNSSPSECSDIEIVETILERPTQVKEPTPTSTIGRTRVTSDTVAARRNIFENSSTPKGQKPSVSSSPSPVGRRPSYMDHTVSSLEHIRRDSLEVNKHNYSRKSSIDSESNYERRPNSAVKFDVPHKPQRTTSIPEDIDVESIFELEVLESLLETVTSYELRRRIRAQIRLVKKNLLNTEMVDKRKTETKTSKSISSTHKTSTYISNVHNEESDSIHEDIKTKKPYESKPSQKHSPQPTKGGRVPESKDVPKKLPYGYSESRYNKEVTRKTTTNDKTPNGRSESPKRPTKTLHERHHSPEIKSPQGSVKEVYHTTGSSLSTHKEYIRNEQTDYSEESFNSSRRVNQSSERFEKDQSRERSYSPETKSPIRDSRQSPDLKTKSVPGIRTKSPDTGKPTSQRTTSPQARTPKQRDDLYTISKTITVKTTHSPERKSSKPRTDESTPIWADRKNLLKSPSSTPRKVPASPSMRTTATKTTTSKSTSQRQTQNRNFEEDSITSSYGIGPTDENGLPLFGIKALKKKKPSQPCEATEEVTGYVIEEKYYSDNKTKPKVERKEYIYSTNADELEEIKKTVEQSRKSSQDDVDVIRKFEKIDKDYVFEKPEAILPDSEDFTTSSKYVRRGSVKELSEKFIRKESSQSTTEKSAGYPKAGLILRTSRGPSTDPSGDSYETTTEKYTTTSSSGHAYRPMEGDSDDEYNVQLRQKQSRVFTDYDDNESEQRHLSTRSSSKSTRSFLNSSGETKVVTSMDEALERMRNADYVVEAGDTAEDQEARSLLNKFLGASVIMKGVESVLPTTKQTTTTTITKTSYADDDADSDLLKNKAVKTTRITKTTKSGSSSTPVTRTTCDIEEIWDEELLQALLEQATTYEERRKIRARLRDLMAEREEKKDLKSGEISENAPEVDESSASEYEEIIEEITVSDYSDAEDGIGGEEITSNQNNTISESKDHKKDVEKEEKETKETVKVQAASKPKIDKAEKVEEVVKKEKSEAEEEVNKSEEVQATDKSEAKAAESDIKASNSAKEECEAKSSVDKTDSNSVNDGECLVPLLQGILQKSLPKVNAKLQETQEKTLNTELNQAAETSTRTNKACSNSSSSESSDLCTVNNYNNNCTDHTNTNNNTQTESIIQTINDDSKNYTNTNKSLASEESQSTMTRDIVMKTSKSTAKSSGSSNRSSDSVSTQKQFDRLGVPQREDSGTESGEDLRLIAAGLRDSLQLQSDTNLIEEVTTALARLELSLKEGKDIPVDGSKREALLALVARLQTGLTSPDAALNLSNMAANAGPYDETSSPEADAHRSNRQRFARRRNRNSRHTVGVSREELEDARRYMEDMQLIENISNCTTPESGMTANPNTPPQWFPIEKNAPSSTILTSTSSSTLYRPNQFVPTQLKNATTCLNGDKQNTHREKDNPKSKRPLSGNFSVSFQPNVDKQNNSNVMQEEPSEFHLNGSESPDSSLKSNRFSCKKQLLKRANTIDIPKSKKYNPDFDTDSDGEDKAPQLGLKRTLQVNVKHKVRNVIPPFVPKTENDHKFLAFINKQSTQPGLGWAGSRSVSNWTNKFGNLKHTFEVGAAAQATTGKPPQAPGHVSHSSAKNYWQKQVLSQDYQQQQQQQQQQYLQYQQLQQQTLQHNQQEANERQRRLERERFERERIECDRLERQRLERERQERDRIEREYYEREIMERERLAAAQHAAMPSMTVPKPAPVNKFQHAPQSVFRPIDNNDTFSHNIFKPIAQMPQKLNTWQPPSISNKPLSAPAQISPASPQFLTTKQSVNGTHVTSPSSTTSSPIGLPWVAKPAVDNTDFRKKAHTFEERSQNDNRQNSYLQRHHSLRSPKVSQQQMDEYKKRPSLPSTADPYMAAQSQYVPQQPQQSQVYSSTTNVYAPPPPPTNISFTYADMGRTSNYKSYPCLPSAVETSITADYARPRESSLTNPNATPLVLTSSNPTYEPSVGNRAHYNSIPPVKQLDFASPLDSAPTSPSILTMQQTDYTDDDIDSDNLMEYRAETRVMGKPQSQTAVTVRDRRTAHASDDEVFGKNSRNAQNLLYTMRNIGKNGNGGAKVKKEPVRKVESPKVCLSPDGRAYQAPIVEPLFPQLTKFEPNRTPEYIDRAIKNQAQNNHKKTRPKTPPMPSQKMDRTLQLARAEEKYLNKYANVGKTAKEHQQQVKHQMSGSVSNISSTNSAPYVSETQTAYVVTYPTEEIYENGYTKQVPTSLPLQRNRNVSENSSASSTISHNLPLPGTSWTPNPIHVVDEIIPKNKSRKAGSINNLSQNTYQPQTQNYNNIHSMPQAKPNVAAKPSVPSAQYVPPPQSHSTYQQQYTQSQSSNSKPTAQQQLETKLPHQERQHQPKAEIVQQQPQAKAKPTPKLSTRSHTITSASQSQSFEQHSETQQMTLPKQRPFDVEITPLQTQNRVLSQQSLVSSKQRQFEQSEQEQQKIAEIRRKSLGNVLDIQQQQRRAAYLSEAKTVIKQEYKSSAPADTPDIVKSSLPKEDMPILKKFGPPQRHHYVPNSYQSPVTNKQTQKFESSTRVIKNTKHEIVQHSTLTKKPSIVEIPATPQPDEDLIPRNIVFNNISAFTSMSRRQEENGHTLVDSHPRTNRLSKSDSWNQILQMQNQTNMQLPPTSPKFGNSGASGTELRRTKSGHTLNVRMYEAGIDKAEVGDKKRTVEAYFTGKKSPNQFGGEMVEMRTATTTTATTSNTAGTKKSTINRHKTSEKISASRKSLTTMSSNGAPAGAIVLGGGLTRSATMPHIANLNLLDESNVEDAFEQLMMEQQATSTTEKTETKEKDGAVVTTTTKVTTRTVTGAGSSAAKPVSPFAKFRQLDKQSSQQSKSPSTPTTPGGTASPSGSARIFQFTDPALNARAATVKEQLLQWCQSKTQEYENVQITNFSASWSDGLAFCALIHHFLPDAFDYSKLTPKSRRHNFELAFTVADEKAGIAPLLDVEDMVEMKRPDWKCVFIYVQSIYRRFRNCQ